MNMKTMRSYLMLVLVLVMGSGVCVAAASLNDSPSYPPLAYPPLTPAK